ncbi:ABC-2 type transport system permease protein [Enterococcus sp. PF1-24]|uniref:ABC transporter permease n=1 Tax=unclassified Enterococcus TaxID=2608891 RepID=UPI002476C765|nr:MULTISPECIES: ABC transporter permease [unclassified Enterococcus]MDH6363732.1 ABC-2 type transport system permease protein [Enterococcus sp. PFB1-1]MDH6400688.1 ABC-2 type transport system permease protein [Enterococcus sp. PF1-24]
MNLNIQKTAVLTRFKFKELTRNKTFLISALLVPLFTVAIRFVYANMFTEHEMPSMLMGMVLNIGLLMNLTMIGLMMPATMLAKDKEKNTLRTLMTSSVNGLEYFISAVLPNFLVSWLICIAVLLISGVQLSSNEIILFLVVSGMCSLISCVLGMLVGLFAKNQMASGNISSLLMLVIMMVPMFSSMVPSLAKVAQFIYTGIIGQLATSFVEGNQQGLSVQSWLVLVVELVASIVLFVVSYRKNGFERE